MSIIECTDDNFENVVLDGEKPVLVDFNATWCPPCQALRPILEDLAEKRDDFQIAAVDIDESPELADRYRVSSIPCLIAFRNGKEIDRRVGLQPEKRIIKMLGL